MLLSFAERSKIHHNLYTAKVRQIFHFFMEFMSWKVKISVLHTVEIRMMKKDELKVFCRTYHRVSLGMWNGIIVFG